MNITFSRNAWDDHLSWQKEAKKYLEKLMNALKIFEGHHLMVLENLNF